MSSVGDNAWVGGRVRCSVRTFLLLPVEDGVRIQVSNQTSHAYLIVWYAVL